MATIRLTDRTPDPPFLEDPRIARVRALVLQRRGSELLVGSVWASRPGAGEVRAMTVVAKAIGRELAVERVRHELLAIVPPGGYNLVPVDAVVIER